MTRQDFANEIREAGNDLQLTLERRSGAHDPRAPDRPSTVQEKAILPEPDVDEVFTVKEAGIYTKGDFDITENWPGEVYTIELKKGDSVFVKHRAGSTWVVVKVEADGSVGDPAWVPEACLRKAGSRASKRSRQSVRKKAQADASHNIEFSPPWPMTVFLHLDDAGDQSQNGILQALGFQVATNTAPSSEGGRGARKAKSVHLVTSVTKLSSAAHQGLQQGDVIRCFNKKNVESKDHTSLLSLVDSAVRNTAAFTLEVFRSADSGHHSEIAEAHTVTESEAGNHVSDTAVENAAVATPQDAKSELFESGSVSQSHTADPASAGSASDRGGDEVTSDASGDDGTGNGKVKSRKKRSIRSRRRSSQDSSMIVVTFSPPFGGGLGFAITAKRAATEGQRGSMKKSAQAHVITSVGAGRRAAIAGLKQGQRIRQFNKKNVQTKSTLVLQQMIAKAIQSEEEFTLGVSDPTESELEIDKADRESQEHAAAAKIQAGFRGSMVRNQRRKEESAAIKIQAATRGHAARKRALILLTREDTSLNWGFRMRYSTDDYPMIEYVNPKSPAGTEGSLQPGMCILEVNGERTFGVNGAQMSALTGGTSKLRVVARRPFGAPPTRPAFVIDSTTTTNPSDEHDEVKPTMEAKTDANENATAPVDISPQSHGEKKSNVFNDQDGDSKPSDNSLTTTLTKSSSEKWGVSFHFSSSQFPHVKQVSPRMAGARCSHLRSGVVVTAVDDVSTHGIDIHRFADLLRGKNTIRLTLLNDGETAKDSGEQAFSVVTTQDTTEATEANPSTPSTVHKVDNFPSDEAFKKPSELKAVFEKKAEIVPATTIRRARPTLDSDSPQKSEEVVKGGQDSDDEELATPMLATPATSAASQILTKADFLHDKELITEEVIELLTQGGKRNGSFLVHKFRHDATTNPTNVLCVLHGQGSDPHITTHTLKKTRDGFLVDNASYGGATTLEEAVSALRDEATCEFGGWAHPLTNPVAPKQSNVSEDKALNPVEKAAREEALVNDRFRRERAKLKSQEDLRKRQQEEEERRKRDENEAMERQREKEEQEKAEQARQNTETRRAHRRTSKQLLLEKFNVQDEPDQFGSRTPSPRKSTSPPKRWERSDSSVLSYVKEDDSTFEGFPPSETTSPRKSENFEGFGHDEGDAAEVTPPIPPQKPSKRGKPGKLKKESIVTSSGLKPPTSAMNKKSDEKKGWFNTFRRKQAVDTVIETRTVLQTIDVPQGEEFTTCQVGDVVEVIRELPDDTVVIKTKTGRALLPAEAFIARRQSSEGVLDDLNLEMFMGGK